MQGVSRRRFLVVGGGLVLAGPAALAACGGDDPSSSGDGGGGGGDLSLLYMGAPGVLATGSQRLVIGVADTTSILAPADLPKELSVRFELDGKAVGDPITAPMHAGLPRAYFPVRASLPDEGTYDVFATVKGDEISTVVDVVAPDKVVIPQVGDQLKPFDTPTTADGHGVDPICTRVPVCSLHDVTLTQALGEGKPVAFLIATPAYCQTAACGPVLDVLLSTGADYADRVRMVHAEVYTDRTIATTAPVVNAYQMPFEPCLFLADASGTIVERLDVLFDADEVKTALERLVKA